VNTCHRRGLLVAVIATILASPLARAELPSLQPFQTLEPTPDEVSPDPQQPPQTVFFGSSVALDHSTLLSGMPGIFESEGRVAIFTRNAAGSWARSDTLTASDPTRGARFGNHVALAGDRALIASNTEVYVFSRKTSGWRQTQKLRFLEPVSIADLDWNGSLAIVGVGNTSSNGFYAFGLTSAGRLQRIGKFTAHDTAPTDQFGSHVALSGAIVAIAAPGYNAAQGAAYVFGCSLANGCRERQKLLANDGAPHDRFGTSIDLVNRVLVVGAPNVDPEFDDTGSLSHSGAGYVFVRPNSEWIETQKLRPTLDESRVYTGLGFEVAVSTKRVLISSPGVPGVSAPKTFLYDWSGGALVATHTFGQGFHLLVSAATAIAGDGGSRAGTGFADVYHLPPDRP